MDSTDITVIAHVKADFVLVVGTSRRDMSNNLSQVDKLFASQVGWLKVIRISIWVVESYLHLKLGD